MSSEPSFCVAYAILDFENVVKLVVDWVTNFLTSVYSVRAPFSRGQLGFWDLFLRIRTGWSPNILGLYALCEGNTIYPKRLSGARDEHKVYRRAPGWDPTTINETSSALVEARWST